MRNTMEAQIAEMHAAHLRPLRTGVGSDGQRKFSGLIEAHGGIPVNSGWPDFAVFGKDDRLKALVEVRPDRGRWKLRDDQLSMLAQFASFGFPTFVWSPSEVVRIDRDRRSRSMSEEDFHEASLGQPCESSELEHR
jgi:hypothetical protein